MTDTTTQFGGTAKQRAFIESLMADRMANEDETFEALLGRTVPGGSAAVIDRVKSVQDASALISEMLAHPRAGRTPTTRPADPPIGIHYVDGVVYKVQAARTSGRVYAKALETAEAAWVYVGRRPFGELNESTLMTEEQAKEFGRRFGICAVCGATLTAEESVERGIGPVCITRIGRAA